MGKEIRRAERFAERLAECYDEDLVAVVLYGSAARGDYREGTSDLNVLVVLRSLEAAMLHRGSSLAREWVDEGNPPPLILSEAEWRGSADVFPIEYTEMREAHVLLHGSDPFAGLDIHWEDLRLQCEHELKGKKIQLRERYLTLADSPEELGQVLVYSLSTFLTLFRTALRLAGGTVPPEPEGVVGALADRVGFDVAPLHAILEARGKGKSLRPDAEDPVVIGYLDAVAKTADWLDRLQS